MTRKIRRQFISDSRLTAVPDSVLQIMNRMVVAGVDGGAMPVALGADTNGKIKAVIEYLAA